MNDTFREYTSYGKVVLPLLKLKHVIKPVLRQWGNKDQYFLFFRAPKAREKKLVIYLHGGGWNSNSPKLHYYIGQKFATEGYDCVMLGYRKAPKVRYPMIVEDVFTGYRKSMAYLREKGLSYDKVIVSGSSAGGHLAALLCFDEERKAAHGIREDAFSALLSLAGPLSFDHEQTGSLNHLLKGLFGTKDREVWKSGEPIRKMTKQEPLKVFLIQSKHDGLVGYEQADDFYKKALKLGMEAQLYPVADVWDTHSLYCVGCFLQEKETSDTLKTVFEMIEKV